MFIDITVKIYDKDSLFPINLDFSIDERQKISYLIELFKTRVAYKKDIAYKAVKSLKLGKVLSVDLSFKEAGITSGDLIEIIGRS